MIKSKLSDYHFVSNSELPISRMSLVHEVLMNPFAEASDSEPDTDFAAVAGESSTMHASEEHRAPTDAGLICFRTLRDNPSAMHTLPHAPAIRDTQAFAGVLENCVAGRDGMALDKCQSYFVRVSEHEHDIGARAVIITPTLFGYAFWRGMRRGILNTTAVYDFNAIGDVTDIHPDVRAAVLNGIIPTAPTPTQSEQLRYIVTSSAKRRDEQVAFLERLEACHCVRRILSTGDMHEMHWRLTDIGASRLRVSFELQGLALVHEPLPEDVPCRHNVVQLCVTRRHVHT